MYSAFGICGVGRRHGDKYYAENSSFRTHVKDLYKIEMYSYNKEYAIEIKDPAKELPHKVMALAVENDIWGLLLKSIEVYKSKRNYPLKDLLEHVGPILDSIEGTTHEELLCNFRAMIPGLRQSGKLAEVAAKLEGVRFTDKGNTRKLRKGELELYATVKADVPVGSLAAEGDMVEESEGPVKRQRVQRDDEGCGDGKEGDPESEEEDPEDPEAEEEDPEAEEEDPEAEEEDPEAEEEDPEAEEEDPEAEEEDPEGEDDSEEDSEEDPAAAEGF